MLRSLNCETRPPNLTYRYFRPIFAAAKLPRIRLYDLRHSCATLLLIAEENPKVVSERLGHSTIVLTLDTYSHVLPHMQQSASARLEKLLYSLGVNAPQLAARNQPHSDG